MKTKNSIIIPDPQTLPNTIEYHRKPTPSEIKFGHGATHYLDFDKSEYLKANGDIKSRIKCKITGLIYTR